jgi:hypothetical protein
VAWLAFAWLRERLRPAAALAAAPAAPAVATLRPGPVELPVAELHQ